MNGHLFSGIHNLHQLSDVESRSISPENFTGEKGRGGMATRGTGEHAARDLGQGWKISPSVRIEPGQTFTLCDIAGGGVIQHIWMTPTGHNRFNILRIYWDDSPAPAVECPVGDFFASGWGPFGQISSLAVCVNPGSAFNCYWPMPFRKRCRITMENLATEAMVLYYQIDYALAPPWLGRGGRRVLPRAVPPGQSASVRAGLHDPRQRPWPRTLRRHVHGVGREQHRLVGRG